jgi:hypothetical protein
MSERDRWAPCRFCVPTSLKSAVFFWSFFWRLCCFSFLSFSFCLLTQSRGWRLAFCSVSVPHRWMCGDLPLFFFKTCFLFHYFLHFYFAVVVQKCVRPVTVSITALQPSSSPLVPTVPDLRC